MCMLSLLFTQTVGRFRCTRKPEMLRLRSQNFACEVMNFACETILFRHAPSQAIEIVGARNLRFRGFVRFQGFTTHFISPYFSPFVFRSHAVSGPSLNSVSLNSSIARIRFRGKPKGESVVSKFDVWSLEFHLWDRPSRTSSTRVPSSPK
jgi:hypothetical protein